MLALDNPKESSWVYSSSPMPLDNDVIEVAGVVREIILGNLRIVAVPEGLIKAFKEIQSAN